MPLSRLDNFLKNVRGNILYVNPNDLDATDSIENQGNSLARPFVTIQRALIEAARFSYQSGLDNDRFGKTTIMIYPADHVVDNRPGWIPDGANNFRLRNGLNSNDFPAFNDTSNFNLNSSNNILYKLNSIYGGVIVPRGVSLVGVDLRKTKIRPKYVPNPENDNIERSAIFRLTGGSYISEFTILDADPNGSCFKDYTENLNVPNFSHHKLTAFEYADGVNPIDINDTFLTYFSSRTDLDAYYEKVGLVYGPASGREISPDYPASGVDIQPKIDEYRIVGPTGGEVGISSIKAGDGATPTTTITVTLNDGVAGLNVDTAIQINNVTEPGYDGSYVVNEILTVDGEGTTSFTYIAPTAPSDALPSPAGSTLVLDTDTISSSSPYLFNISCKSTYGMCGLHADGSKVNGFKSMLASQFTGIGLQKDDNAFVVYDEGTGSFDDSTTIENIHSNANAKYKPSYLNYHVKASNDAFVQLVSIFGVGFSRQFVTESGGDLSISNSNSNFGQNAFVSSGYKVSAFDQDDVGYITHIIPPQEITSSTINIEYESIDVSKTISVGQTGRLYLYQQTNESNLPNSVIQGYRVGAKVDDHLKLKVGSDEYFSRIVLDNSQNSYQKEFNVGRNVGTGNSISASTITFTENHTFTEGETVRVISDNARLPDGIESNHIYYAITSGLDANQIQLAITYNDALTGDEVSINNLGGSLTVQSRVSDKISGEIGHPIQFDSTEGQWFVNVATASTENQIYSTIVSLGTTSLGDSTSRTYIERIPDNRSLNNRIYQARYVLPAGSGISSARPPLNSYVIQESNDVTGKTDTEVALQFNPGSVTMTNETEMRNFSFIRKAEWSGGDAYYTTELPHQLTIGSRVKVVNTTSTNNVLGVGNSGFNGTFTVTGISSATQFRVTGDNVNPGDFTNNTSDRTVSLPTFQRIDSNENVYVYDSTQISEYSPGQKDGVYLLTLIDGSNEPKISPFNSDEYQFSQPLKNLYPQLDRDNPNSDPNPVQTYAQSSPLGEVVIDNVKNSLTKQTSEHLFFEYGIGVGITNIVSTSSTTHTIYTEYDHGLNRATGLVITTPGAGYGDGTGGVENIYNASLVGSTNGRNATARITVDASGSVTAIKLMNEGTGYEINDVLNVVSTATTTGYSVASVAVTSIYNNIGETISVAGISSYSYNDYNQSYRITGINTTGEIQVISSRPVSGFSTLGIGATVSTYGNFRNTGGRLDVSSLVYNNVTGIATVTTVQAHSLIVNNKITFGGSDSSLFNGDFLVTENVGLTTFKVDIGVSTLSPSPGGNIKGFYPGFTAQGGDVNVNNSALSGRNLVNYAGITTVLSGAVLNATTQNVEIQNVNKFNFNIGDYLMIDEEIVRIKTTVTSNPVRVFRGLFGTSATSHISGSVVRRIKPYTVEFRRPSSIRATGHTFEYVGFGPGNYSTALPERQGASLTPTQKVLSYNFQSSGGKNNFNGTDDEGNFFLNNSVTYSNTGKTVNYDIPSPTVTGEDPYTSANVDYTRSNFSAGNYSDGIKVEGGLNNNIISEFQGPVVFSEKVTATSPDGLETVSVYLQGDTTVSRKYTVGLTKPTAAGNAGDVVYNANPTKGGTIGWTYTLDRGWYPFGSISVSQDGDEVVFYKVGIGTTSVGDCSLKVGSGTSEFCVDVDGVGIGTTANGYKLNVVGDSNISGVLTATKLVGDGSGITNLSNDSRWFIDAGSGDVVPHDNRSVGVGTTIPTGNYTLEVGTTGAATTDLYVRNQSRFVSKATFDGDATVNGTLNASNIKATGGQIQVGIITATTALRVGTSQTVFSATSRGVGIGLATPTEDFDVAGRAKFSAYYENVQPVTISSGTAIIDLSTGNSFQLDVTSAVNEFQIINPVSGSTFGFTLKIVQGGTAFGVGINTFVDSLSNAVQVYWPGGILPEVTTVANAEDIYSFMSFNGGQTLYGGVGGQNFTGGVPGTPLFDGWTYDPGSKTVTIYDNLRVINNINSLSDSSLKENVSVIDNALDKIIKIDGVNFNWKSSGKESMGVIAQEVEKILPQLIDEFDNLKSVNYNGLIGLLIEAIKELNDKIDSK